MDLFNRKKVKDLEQELLILREEFERNKGQLIAYENMKNAEKVSTQLAEENQKLIKWIRSILDEFGTMEVRDRERVKIPILIRKEEQYFKANHGGEGYFHLYPRETITIPEIIIEKMC